MIRPDMPVVLEIEREASEFPWFEEEFIKRLRQLNCIAIVAEVGDGVVGFVVYELFKLQMDILNFAVASDMRRRGVGQALANKLIGKLSQYRLTRITLNIRETNLSAQHFFQACGFRAIEVLHDYYDDSDEDAYLFEYKHLWKRSPASGEVEARAQ